MVYPLYVSIFSHEISKIENLVEYQENNHELLVGIAFSNVISQFKLVATKKKKPNILVLGTSRVMQFREKYFNIKYKFYNAGGGVDVIEAFLPFLKCLDSYPEVLIIGLDQYFFNSEWRENYKPVIEYNYEISPKNVFSAIIKQFLSGKLIKVESIKNKNIGLTAIKYNEGFRYDGSYYYGRIIEQPNSEYSLKYIYPFNDTIRRIEDKTDRFEYGSEIDLSSLEELIQLLKFCQDKNIFVIAIIPPYAPYINERMKISNGYSYLEKLYSCIEPIFKKYDFEIYDYTYNIELGDDRMYIDGFHGNDEIYKNILIDISRYDSKINDYLIDIIDNDI